MQRAEEKGAGSEEAKKALSILGIRVKCAYIRVFSSSSHIDRHRRSTKATVSIQKRKKKITLTR